MERGVLTTDLLGKSRNKRLIFDLGDQERFLEGGYLNQLGLSG